MADAQASPSFLSGGGEMGALMRSYDWASSPLGPPESWPQSLRVTIRLMLTSQHPIFIWWGPDLIQFYNDAYRQTMGPAMHPSALGARGRESWADIWPIIGPQIERVMSGQGATWNVEQLVPINRNGMPENVWWTYGYSPIDLEGKIGGVLVICNDVTEHVLAEQRLELVNRELQHRVKNTLAMVQAIATQTLRDIPERGRVDILLQRLMALSRAHDTLVQQNWSAADITSAARTSVESFGMPGRFEISGPSVELGPSATLSLSMILHELSTNAIKYGALSVEGGRVELTWDIDRSTDQAELVVRWKERGGPVPVEPEGKGGFGTKLVRMGLDGTGKVTLDFAPTGLSAELRAPLDGLYRT